MSYINLRSDVRVELLDSMGNDAAICQAARVSNLGAESLHTGEAAGLINYLVSNRHGSPFEHCSMKFFIEAPIFVFREFHRHRVGWSYNEVSGRYTELKPDFYVPGPGRPLVNVGTSARPEFFDGPVDQHERTVESLARAYECSWLEYQAMLKDGVAKEIARAALGTGIYSAMHATCNPRSLMHFLGLRTQRSHAMFRSRPQMEISMVADQMEQHFTTLFPLTWNAFNKDRVAP